MAEYRLKTGRVGVRRGEQGKNVGYVLGLAVVMGLQVKLPRTLLEVQAIGTVLMLLIAFLAVAWIVLKKRSEQIEAELESVKALVKQRERERDLAQEELLRHLHDEQKLATEKVQFEAQLTDYEKYAALAQLALGAAHEINNPLLGIQSHLELELKAVPAGEEREEIQQCLEGIHRISSTVRGLLDYTKPGPLLLSRIDLNRLAEETVHFLEHQPMLKGVTLRNEVPADLPIIRADFNQISQVLMNILLNAAQATPAGGSITIAAGEGMAGFVEIRVSDTGCGIPADILPHVFDPFFTTKRGNGTGLGLTISRSYVRSHGGDMRIESEPGRGTTVFITLPMRQEVAQHEVEETEIVV